MAPILEHSEDTYFGWPKSILGGTRTLNLEIRSLTPYPLGHEDTSHSPRLGHPQGSKPRSRIRDRNQESLGFEPHESVLNPIGIATHESGSNPIGIETQESGFDRVESKPTQKRSYRDLNPDRRIQSPKC